MWRSGWRRLIKRIISHDTQYVQKTVRSTEKKEIKLGEVNRLRGDGCGRPVGVVRARYHGVGGSKSVHVSGKGKRAGTRKRRRQCIFEVKFLVAFGGLGREEFEDDGLVFVFGGRQNVGEVVGQADLAFFDQSIVDPSGRDEGGDQETLRWKRVGVIESCYIK